MIAGKDILNRAHGALVFGRRVQILAANLAKEIPIRAEVLDVGIGDGSIAKAIALHRPDIKIEGRPSTHTPVRLFDGEHISLSEKTVDVVWHCLYDAIRPRRTRILVREAVSRGYIVIKDHLRGGPICQSGPYKRWTWIGNCGHDIVLPYNYLSEQEWYEYFRDTNLSPERWTERLGLYPFPFSLADALALSHV